MKLFDLEKIHRLTFWLLGVTLVFAPLFRAGNRPLPLAVLISLAVALFALIVLGGECRRQLSGAQLTAVLVLPLLPLLYLLPVDPALWAQLPGRGLYFESLALLPEPAASRPIALSVVPDDTLAAYFRLTLPVAVFLAAVGLPTRRLLELVYLVLLIAAGQSILALIQYGDGPDSLFRLGNVNGLNNGNGTYVNRNHLAGFLNLALPVALALLASTAGRGSRRRAKSLRDRVNFVSSGRGHLAAGFGLLITLMLLGVIFSRSRSGIALLILGLLISTVLLSRKLKSEKIFGWFGTLTMIGFGAAAAIGLTPILQRFVITDPLGVGRLQIFADTMEGVKTFFPLGSGPGTYPKVFPRFQQADFQGFVNHAHNDYLEWLFEAGLLALVLLAVYLVFFIARWRSLRIAGPWSSFRFAQVGAGIGLLLMLLHGLSDYNLHIPANLIFFAFFAAVFFHRHSLEEEDAARRRDRAARDRERRQKRRIRPPSTPSAPIENPFSGDMS